jgi:serine/threonine-protein kinase RsbW
VTPPAVTWQIASRLECVGPLGEEVRAACTTFGLGSAAAGEVELSVVEMVNNTIEHGYQMDGSGWVEVSLESDGRRLRVAIRDGGRAMPAGALANATMPDVDPTRREALPEGGMGLHIVKQLMDDVRYESSEARNTVIMERRIDRPGVPEQGLEGKSDG